MAELDEADVKLFRQLDTINFGDSEKDVIVECDDMDVIKKAIQASGVCLRVPSSIEERDANFTKAMLDIVDLVLPVVNLMDELYEKAGKSRKKRDKAF